MVNFILVGPVTRDRIVQEDVIYESVGGPVYYQSAVFSAFGVDHTVVTVLAREDKYLLHELPPDTHIIPFYSEETMEFENIYPHSDPNHRIQKAKIPHNSIKPTHLTDINFKKFDAVILSPVSPYDIPLETMEYLYKQNVPIYLGAQGYLRQIEDSENLVLKPWKGHENFLKLVKFLFLDEKEVKIILNNKEFSCKQIARILSGLGPDEVIITRGDRGALIYSKNKYYKVPVFPPQKTVDPTGMGDTFMAAYLVKKMDTENPKECAKFASIISSHKIGYKGAYRKNI
jgi:hypothetical protein